LDKNPQSKDDALEALDFIVNVIKEHEKDLDKLINELATVTEQIADTGELSSKVEEVEVKIETMQKEVKNLILQLSGKSQDALPLAIAKQQPNEVAEITMSGSHSVIMRCRQWEDFQNLAMKAQTLSFSYKEEEKIFQAYALKGNQFITYSGDLPKLSSILKTWLSKQFDVSERNILDGILVVG
jgi:seryl-tRNA synthetase